MNLLALDLSLTSTGWAAKFGGEPVASGTITPKPKGVQRLAAIEAAIGALLDIYRPDVTILEGYAFGRPNQAHQIGELGGVVRLFLHRQGRAFVELPPACRAKLATGKGNAGKEQVLAEAIRRLGYTGHSNDEADALWLLMAGMIHYEQACGITLPRGHLDALQKVASWPAAPLARAS